MPHSLRCRLKSRVRRGFLKETDIDRLIIIPVYHPVDITNGYLIKLMFPKCEVFEQDDIVDVYELGTHCVTFDSDWWNAPFNGKTDGKNSDFWKSQYKYKGETDGKNIN